MNNGSIVDAWETIARDGITDSRGRLRAPHIPRNQAFDTTNSSIRMPRG